MSSGAMFTDDGNTYNANTASDSTGSTFDSDDVYGVASSDTLVVSTAIDEEDGDFSGGDLSLREAITLSEPGDTIAFDPSLTTLLIDQGDLFIDKDVNIAGPGAGGLTLDGGAAQRVFFINSGVVSIGDLTIANGLAQGFNGGSATLGGAGGGSAGHGRRNFRELRRRLDAERRGLRVEPIYRRRWRRGTEEWCVRRRWRWRIWRSWSFGE